LFVAVPATAAGVTRAEDDAGYRAENARLARATPSYSHAHLLVNEPIWGDAGSGAFEAVQRIYRLAAPTTQGRILTFYMRRLGHSWQSKGTACLVSGRRAVVAYLYPKRRRLGVVIDSRGAAYCREHVANIAQLLELGYPNTVTLHAKTTVVRTVEVDIEGVHREVEGEKVVTNPSVTVSAPGFGDVTETLL
jgi:hypothetical protein